MIGRDELLTGLDRYRAEFPNEADCVERIAALVREHANCFQRDCMPGHLTASAWVVTPDGERQVLLRHKKLDRWLQPGGHADGEEDLAAVALREASEETGLDGLRIVPDPEGLAPLDVDVHAIPELIGADGRVLQPAHDHHDVRFLVVATGRLELAVSEESHEVRWCDDAQVRKLTSERSVLRLMEKAQLRYDPSLFR